MFSELVKQARSVRRFKETSIMSEDDLKGLVNLARFSPTAANLQVLRFVIFHKPEDREALFPHLKWAGYLRYWDGPVSGERPAGYISILAPANATKFHLIDTGIAAQSIILGAADKGLGACMIASVDKDIVHNMFALPPDLDIVLVIALGVPAEKVVLEDVTDPDDVEYWRDTDDVHHVPKRVLEDLLIPISKQR